MAVVPAVDQQNFSEVARRRFSDLMPSRDDLALNHNDFRAVFLFSACFIYAFFGSPTPEHFGWAEISVGFLLALGIGAGQFRSAFFDLSERSFWRGSGQVFLLYGLSVPLLVAALNGHGGLAILRDVVPFLFWFLPLFYIRLLDERPEYYRTTLFAVLVIGLVFSLRSLALHSTNYCSIWCTDELLYLENMPSVLFCSLFLAGTACARLMRRFLFWNVMLFGICVSLILLPLAAMAITLQRASLGAFVFYLVLVFVYLFFKRPYHAFVLFVCVTAAMAAIGLVFEHVFLSLREKTDLVGLNMRPQEFAVVWGVVTESPFQFLFGIGWGGHFNSPAVGEMRVNFTHNFFTTVLLKSGFCGLLLAVAYISGILRLLFRLLCINPVLGLALAAPILIDLSLYASFKSLDFGLVLLMIPASLLYFDYSESQEKMLSYAS